MDAQNDVTLDARDGVKNDEKLDEQMTQNMVQNEMGKMETNQT